MLQDIELFKTISEGELEIDPIKEFTYTDDTKLRGKDLYSSHENNVISDIEGDSTMPSSLIHSNENVNKLLFSQDRDKKV